MIILKKIRVFSYPTCLPQVVILHVECPYFLYPFLTDEFVCPIFQIAVEQTRRKGADVKAESSSTRLWF